MILSMENHVKSVSFLKGKTLLFTCDDSKGVSQTREITAQVGTYYEIWKYFIERTGLNQFPNLFMNRCDDNDKVNWHINSYMLSIVANSTTYRTNVFSEPTNEMQSEEFLCFEDLYISGRSDYILKGQRSAIKFRKDLVPMLSSVEVKGILSATEV